MNLEDWEQVQMIYAKGIATGIATFETTVPSWAKWDTAHLKFGRLVAVSGTAVLGWIALSPVSTRKVYRGVAEVSIYIDSDHKNKGLGKKLMQNVILISEQMGVWTLQSSTFRENKASYILHERMGFRQIGYRERVAQIHGKWKDNLLWERRSTIIGADN